MFDAERARCDAPAPHLAHPAERLHRFVVVADLEREVVPRLNHLFELLDVDDDRRGAHRICLAAKAGHKFVDNLGLAPCDHVPKVEGGRHRLCREIGQRTQQHVVRLSNVHVVLGHNCTEVRVLHKLHHRIWPIGDNVATRHPTSQLLDIKRRDLLVEAVTVAPAIVRGEQPREAAHLAARVHTFL